MGLVGEECLGVALTRLLHQVRVLRHEGLPFLRISLEQPFLGTLERESQTVQVVQATAAAQADTEALGDVLMQTTFPFQLASSMPACSGNSCTAPFSAACCAGSRAGGNRRSAQRSEPQARPSPKAEAHLPMVCGSRSSASAVACCSPAVGQKPQMAYHHLSLSKGPFPGHRRQNQPQAPARHIHLPSFEKLVHIPHTHHHPSLVPR